MLESKSYIGRAADPRELQNTPLNRIEDIGELRSKLSILEDAIHNLTDHRDRLVSKLQPILQVKPQGTEKGLPTSPSLTEVGHRIQDSIDRICSIARSLDDTRSDAQI